LARSIWGTFGWFRVARPEECGWHKSVPVIGKYAHVHITKATYRVFKDYHWWITPPRIGIDFRKTKKRRGTEWIPNIEIADLVRLIRILRHLRHKNVLESIASKKGFYIAPSFDRRIRIKAIKERIVLDYRDRGDTFYGWTAEIKPEQLPALIKTLEDGYSRYVKLIATWHDTGKLPDDFRHRLD
jgi:hypothetical protein